MELPSKLLEQIEFKTRSRNQKHMLIIMDKSTHEDTYPNHYKLIINSLN